MKIIIKVTHAEMEDIVSKSIGYSCSVEIIEQPKVPSDAGFEIPSELRGTLLSMVQAGNVIEAIKRLRVETGCGLREARDEIDRIR